MFYSYLFLALVFIHTCSCQNSDPYNDLRSSVLNIPNVECMGEILDTFSETTTLLATYGISRRFLAGLSNIQFVAGDIPEAEEFRKQLKSTYDAYEQLLTYQESNITVNATGSSNLDVVGVQKRPSANSAHAMSFAVPFAILLSTLIVF